MPKEDGCQRGTLREKSRSSSSSGREVEGCKTRSGKGSEGKGISKNPGRGCTHWPDTGAALSNKDNSAKSGAQLCALVTVVEKLAARAAANGGLPVARIGVMMFNSDNLKTGAYPRIDFTAVTPLNKVSLQNKIKAISAGSDTAAAAPEVGLGMYEAYLWFKGEPLQNGRNTPSFDPTAFESGSTRYSSPAAASCGRNFIIVVSNGDPGTQTAVVDAELSFLRRVTRIMLKGLKIEKNLLVVLISISFLMPIKSNAGEFREGSEPDGFRGIKWGTEISELQDQNFIYIEERGPKKVYIKKNDNLKIGNALVKNIKYMFFEGKFYNVSMDFVGETNFKKLERALFIKFGEVENENSRFMDSLFFYTWIGNKTLIAYQFAKRSNDGNLTLLSKTINLKDKEYYDLERKRRKEEEAKKIEGF